MCKFIGVPYNISGRKPLGKKRLGIKRVITLVRRNTVSVCVVGGIR